MIGLAAAFVLSQVAIQVPTTVPDPALFDPATGYRVAHYRGVIHDTPPGIPRIASDDAVALHEGRKALFIDVTPAEVNGHSVVSGAWGATAQRQTIPGAHWFPEAGRGPADAQVDVWFAKGVARLTQGRKQQALVVFCLADCWMSWNASLKLKRLGYRTVFWYADGLDGWKDRSLSVSKVGPEH